MYSIVCLNFVNERCWLAGFRSKLEKTIAEVEEREKTINVKYWIKRTLETDTNTMQTIAKQCPAIAKDILCSVNFSRNTFQPITSAINFFIICRRLRARSHFKTTSLIIKRYNITRKRIGISVPHSHRHRHWHWYWYFTSHDFSRWGRASAPCSFYSFVVRFMRLSRSLRLNQNDWNIEKKTQAIKSNKNQKGKIK